MPSTFIDTLSELCNTVERVYGIHCSLSYDSFIPEADETSSLYSIIQEGILNSVSHARGNRINIQLLDDDNWRGIKISDNGRGFLPGSVEYPGMGLRLMQYRAKSINAKLDVQTQEGNGTTVCIELAGNPSIRKEMIS